VAKGLEIKRCCSLKGVLCRFFQGVTFPSELTVNVLLAQSLLDCLSQTCKRVAANPFLFELAHLPNFRIKKKSVFHPLIGREHFKRSDEELQENQRARPVALVFEGCNDYPGSW
jgi:hypothetical protein